MNLGRWSSRVLAVAGVVLTMAATAASLAPQASAAPARPAVKASHQLTIPGKPVVLGRTWNIVLPKK